MTVIEFPRQKDPENIQDFLQAAIDAFKDEAIKPHSIVLISYHKLKEGDGVGVHIGGGALGPIELSGLLSIAKAQVEFNDNMSILSGE